MASAASRSVKSGNQERHPLPPSNRGGRCQLDVLVVDVPLGPPVQDLIEGNAPFETSEARPEAEVQPVSEGQVLSVGAVDVVGVRPLVPAWVTIGRRDDQQDRATG